MFTFRGRARQMKISHRTNVNLQINDISAIGEKFNNVRDRPS